MARDAFFSAALGEEPERPARVARPGKPTKPATDADIPTFIIDEHGEIVPDTGQPDGPDSAQVASTGFFNEPTVQPAATGGADPFFSAALGGGEEPGELEKFRAKGVGAQEGLVEGVKEYLRSAKYLPEKLGELMGVTRGDPRFAANLTADRFLGQEGDEEARRRARAGGMALTLPLAALPVGPAGAAVPAVAARFGIGALTGAGGAAAEAAIAGDDPGSAAVGGAIFGGPLGAVLGGIGRRVAPKAAPVAEAVPFGPLPGERVLDLPAGVEAAVPGLEGVRPPGQPSPIDPNLFDIPPTDVRPSVRDPNFDPGGLPGIDPIPRVPTNVEQLDLLAPQQTTFLGPPAGDPPARLLEPLMAPGKIGTGKVSGLEHFPTPFGKKAGFKGPVPPAVAERVSVAVGQAGIPAKDAPEILSTIVGRPVTDATRLTAGEAARVQQFASQLRNTPDEVLAKVASASPARTQRFVDSGLLGEALDEAGRGYHFMLTGGASFYRRLGEAGQELASLSERTRDLGLQRRAMDGDLVKRLNAQRFTDAEEELVTDVLEGVRPAPNAKIAQAAAALREMYSNYRQELTDLKMPVSDLAGERNPFTGLDDYAPRFYTRHSLGKIKDPALRRQWQAEYNKLPTDKRAGNVQFHRSTNAPGYERRAFKAAAMYIDRVAPRVAQAHVFGPSDEIPRALLRTIGDNYGAKTMKMASDIFTHQFNPAAHAPNVLSRVATDLASVTFLTTAGLLQPAQVMTNTLARAGFNRTLGAVLKFAGSREARREAILTGSTLTSVLDEIAPQGTLGNAWTHFIGLKPLDRINRMISAIAFRDQAESLVQKLADGDTSKATLSQLRYLGLDPTDLARRDFVVSPQELSQAALRGSQKTQFAGGSLALPQVTQKARLLTLYKTFMLQQSAFIKDLVKDAVQDRNPGPLLRYAASLPLAAGTIGELYRLVQQKEAPEEDWQRLAEDIGFVGATGIFTELINAVGRGKEGLLSLAAGPIISEGAGLVGDIGTGIREEDWDPLQQRVLRRTVKRIPVIGNDLYEELAP